ncbi:hypothetical protein VN97_g8381 [Penicillium thymicola]|uniref:Uncharacterized protein n=1 Tax=Penicillium thymicola TaxID=293382 RepID=A0AAI9X5Q6_PENTH|nr:hypothetical protein VN97_g8381 [Penicillium thymicola]
MSSLCSIGRGRKKRKGALGPAKLVSVCLCGVTIELRTISMASICQRQYFSHSSQSTQNAIVAGYFEMYSGFT